MNELASNKFPQYKENIKLNLGCGGQRIDGYIGIDERDIGQEMIWNINNGLPFPDKSVSEIYSCHFLEHLDDDQSVALFHEIYRVLKVKGECHHRMPHQTHPTAYYWGHKTFWNEERINAITRIPGMEKFLIIENTQKNGELFFALKKLA